MFEQNKFKKKKKLWNNLTFYILKISYGIFSLFNFKRFFFIEFILLLIVIVYLI